MMLAAKKNIILLNDGRIGNFNQIKALALTLPKHYQISELNINFSPLIILPNFINLIFKTGVNYPQLLKQLKNVDLIFSAGRRSALAAVLIKNKFPNSKIIQLMRPELNHKYFSFIATPKHDNYQFSDHEMLLAPNLISTQNLKLAAKKWPHLQSPKTKLAVIIGGDTKNNKITEKTSRDFCLTLQEIQKKYNFELMVITSRRTPKILEKTIKEALNHKTQFFLWHKIDKNNNPYLAILNIADYFLVTIDSVSMLSDCLSTHKATIIYQTGFGAKKHQQIAKNLIKNNYTLTIEDFLASKNLSFNTKKLSEIEKLKIAVESKIKL